MLRGEDVMRTSAQAVFTLLRHAESVGNAEGIRQGQGDLPLTERGRAAARALARRWRAAGVTFDQVLTSPLRRAAETAALLAETLHLPAPEVQPLLMERDIGTFTLRPAAEVQADEPPFWPLYEPVGGTGESLWDLYLRAGQVVAHLARRPPGHYLVVAHGMLLNMLLQALLGIVPQAHFWGPHFLLPNLGVAVVVHFIPHHRWALVHLAGPDALPPLGRTTVQ